MTSPSYRNNNRAQRQCAPYKGRRLPASDHGLALSEQHPTREEFSAQVKDLAAQIDAVMNVKQFCRIAGITRTNYYKWVRGLSTPMLLVRRALLAIMRELVKP
jgi:hypothetical protein